MEDQQRAVGLTAGGEQLYRHLLRSTPGPAAEHADALGWRLEETRDVLAQLEDMRLARTGPDGTVRVDDPRASVGRLLDTEEALLDRRRHQLLELRESLEGFESDYRRGLQLSGPRLPAWEQVARAEVTSVVEHLLRTSSGPILQVRATSGAGPGHEEPVRPHWDALSTSGRELRTVFPSSVLDDHGWDAFADRRAAAGEQQRYLSDDAIRVEFGIFGRSGVLLEESGPDPDYLLLRPSSMLDAFRTLFDELWRRAQPMLAQDAGTEEVVLVKLLSLGFKDEAIARQMGLGLRTVRRRIAAMMQEHGAHTRFQLGRVVARRGVLEQRPSVVDHPWAQIE